MCDRVGGCLGRPESILDPLELELETGVSCLMWVLGAQSGSSGRAASTLPGWAISPASSNKQTEHLNI